MRVSILDQYLLAPTLVRLGKHQGIRTVAKACTKAWCAPLDDEDVNPDCNSPSVSAVRWLLTYMDARMRFSPTHE